jgi:hypothetical protein
MKLVSRGIAVALASLGLMGGAAAQVEALLYSFTGGTDGGYPLAGLIADSEARSTAQREAAGAATMARFSG